MSAAHPDDPRVKFTNEETGESLELEYEWPMTDAKTGSRTTVHECIGTKPVVQHLGPTAREYDFRCLCYYDEADFLEALPEASLVRIRSHRFTGYAVVDDVQTVQTGGGGGKRSGINNRVLKYRISVTQTDAPEDST